MLSLMTNGGELKWLARDPPRGRTAGGSKLFGGEYMEIMNRYPGA